MYINTSSEHLPKRAKTAALRQVQVCFHSAKTIEFLKDNKLSAFTQNKSISKICDSFRAAKEDKEYLKQNLRKK